MNEQEQQAILSICILAAFADGAQSEAERSQIRRVLERFANEHLDLSAVYQDVLQGNVSLGAAVNKLPTSDGRALAYEMAVCVCNADGALSEAESRFLADLRRELHLEAEPVMALHQAAGALAAEPLAAPPRMADAPAQGAGIDEAILNCAILTGALEIMPHSLATLAIVPLQMRMVYRIGKSYGYELGRGHITDFLATVGIGLTSQVFEGYARRLIGGLARGLVGGLAGQATGSAFAFATTYALGQVAKRYYAGGRTLDAAQLKEVFASMLNEGRFLQNRYAGDIATRSRQVNVNELLPLVKQSG